MWTRESRRAKIQMGGDHPMLALWLVYRAKWANWLTFQKPLLPICCFFLSPEKNGAENIWNHVHFGAVSEVLEIEVNGAKQAHQNVAFLPHIFCSQKISGRKCDVNKTHTRLTRQRCWFFHIFQYLRDLMLKLFVYLPFSSPSVYISSTPVWFTRLFFSSQPIWHVDIVFFPV